jgi:hypothetical protein
MHYIKRSKLATHCFNYISEYIFKEVPDVIDRMQTMHDIAMMLEGHVLENAKPKFIPQAMKDIERDIKTWIEFHNKHKDKNESN